MGGGTSKFEEMEWDKADGKLRERSQTVDNAPPTSQYGVYYLNKLGVNQRDYDVTDTNSNLIYSTRAIEGTLAWFDVLGRGIDDYLLRVQVDLSRRYWVVYRYGFPAFAGQLLDAEATMRRKDRSGPHKALFRRACITVTWARYHAVVDFYEPPPRRIEAETEEPSNDDDDEDDGIEQLYNELVEEMNADAIVVATGEAVEEDGMADIDMHAETESSSHVEPNASSDGEAGRLTSEPPGTKDESTGTEEYPKKSPIEATGELYREGNLTGEAATTSAIPDAKEQLSSNLTRASNLRASMRWVKANAASTFIAGAVSRQAAAASAGDATVTADTEAPNISRHGNDVTMKVSKSSSSLRNSLHNLKTKAYEAVEAPYQPKDLAEGVITLNNPVLKVQEINSFTGQFQTMLIREDEAKRLKQEELLIEEKLAEEARASATEVGLTSCVSDTLCACSTSDIDDDEEDLSHAHRDSGAAPSHSADESDHDAVAAEAKVDSTKAAKEKSPIEDGSETSAAANGDADGVLQPSYKDDSASANDFPPHIAEPANHVQPEPDSTLHNQDASPNADNEDSEDEQPLVGFWVWENSIRVFKMKMHVGKGADLALHVVLAVVTNQLRYERNATIAASV